MLSLDRRQGGDYASNYHPQPKGEPTMKPASKPLTR